MHVYQHLLLHASSFITYFAPTVTPTTPTSQKTTQFTWQISRKSIWNRSILFDSCLWHNTASRKKHQTKHRHIGSNTQAFISNTQHYNSINQKGKRVKLRNLPNQTILTKIQVINTKVCLDGW